MRGERMSGERMSGERLAVVVGKVSASFALFA